MAALFVLMMSGFFMYPAAYFHSINRCVALLCYWYIWQQLAIIWKHDFATFLFAINE